MKETFFWTFSSDAISTLSDLTSEGFEAVSYTHLDVYKRQPLDDSMFENIPF